MWKISVIALVFAIAIGQEPVKGEIIVDYIKFFYITFTLCSLKFIAFSINGNFIFNKSLLHV